MRALNPMPVAEPPAEPTVRKWTRQEYYRMADLGFFQDQRVELISGEILKMAPQKDVHAAAVGLVRRAVAAVFEPQFWVREQMPLSVLNASEPEPDVSVVAGGPRDIIGKGHPRSALLVVEVSDTTLAFDLGGKASLYAAAGMADYWVVDLQANQLHVHREPLPDATQPHGFRYAYVTVRRAGDRIIPLAAPQAPVSVSDLLP